VAARWRFAPGVGKVPLSLPDVEIEVTCRCPRRCCTLLLGRLCLGRRGSIFLLLLGCGGLARDESSYPSQCFYVLRRSSKPLEAYFKHPRNGVLNLRDARVGHTPRVLMQGRKKTDSY
jgi:hypothetical protein